MGEFDSPTMNQINMNLLVAPMHPQHQVLGASPEDKIDRFKHSPEYQRVAPLLNIPKGTNNDRYVGLLFLPIELSSAASTLSCRSVRAS
jgi:hypothetical protein